jgi:hypothetical protein
MMTTDEMIKKLDPCSMCNESVYSLYVVYANSERRILARFPFAATVTTSLVCVPVKSTVLQCWTVRGASITNPEKGIFER